MIGKRKVRGKRQDKMDDDDDDTNNDFRVYSTTISGTKLIETKEVSRLCQKDRIRW